MGGDDWSFLDEECAKLEKKGGKKGGARVGGGAAVRATAATERGQQMMASKTTTGKSMRAPDWTSGPLWTMSSRG